MNDFLTDIDNFFEGNPDPQQRREFEERVKSDPEFAEEVNFYLSARVALKEELEQQKKLRFRQLLEKQNQSIPHRAPVRMMWRYAAAAAVVVVLALSYFLFQQPTQREYALNYFEKHYSKLSVSMGKEDSVQIGLDYYNASNYKSALQVFENILISDPNSSTVTKYARLASLQLAEYDKALNYFTKLANFPDLYSNAGVFLQAITLSKRNRPGDQERAKELMQIVVKNDLGEKKAAQEFLSK